MEGCWDVVGRTTVNSDTAEVLDCISVDPKKGEDFYRTVIKEGTEYIWYRFADAEPPKPPEECEHVRGKAGDGIIYVDDKGRVKLDVKLPRKLG